MGFIPIKDSYGRPVLMFSASYLADYILQRMVGWRTGYRRGLEHERSEEGVSRYRRPNTEHLAVNGLCVPRGCWPQLAGDRSRVRGVDRKDLRARVDRGMPNVEIALVDRALIAALEQHMQELDKDRELDPRDQRADNERAPPEADAAPNCP